MGIFSGKKSMNQQAAGFDVAHHVVKPLAGLEIGENKRPLTAHAAGVLIHHLE
jgi:hypothetical protein